MPMFYLPMHFDAHMYAQVASLSTPYILQHMRGDPTTMQQPANITYCDILQDVGQELKNRLDAAKGAGVESWRMVVDPGIGFSKDV